MRNESDAPRPAHRPRLPQEKRHRKSLTVRAKTVPLPVSVYVRKAALAHRLEVIQIPASNLQLIVALSRIGNNLNQLTRLAHQGRLPSSLVPLLEELLALLDGQKDMASGASTGAPS
jgi:Bacterial mobilisation protein (MobC)